MPASSDNGRIAYLTGEYPAVSHTFILREVEALRKAGHDVITCSIRRTSAQHHRGQSERSAAASTFYVLQAVRNPIALLRSHLKALRTPRRYFKALHLAWQTRSPGLKATIYQLFYFLEAGVLARHLQDAGVTHLHNHFANSSCSVAMLASALSDIPFSFTLHGPAIFFEPRRWRIDEKIARAQFVACISHFCRSQGMIFADPAYWSKMHIVHCGVLPDDYRQTEPKSAEKRLLFVGRLAAVKGVRVLLEAFAKTLEQHPDAHLTLVGDGDERGEIEVYIAQLGCQNAITLTGYLSQKEVAEELARASVFTLPSFAEGVPVVLMEAMASGLPVVATRIAGISELVTDGETGLCVPPGDVEAFAYAITSILDDQMAGVQMGMLGQERVARDFNIATEAVWLGELLTTPGLRGTLRPTDTD